jgi:hypothetical protein
MGESGYQMLSLDGAKAMVAGALGVVAVMLMVVKLHEIVMPKSGMVGYGQWLGAQHNIQRSDVYGDKKRTAAISPFFSGNAVGPEFVEQPNYVLGQQDMMRTALTKFNRLKSSGAPVGAWAPYWAAYQAENADDLSASMYDFGDDSEVSTAGNSSYYPPTAATTSGMAGKPRNFAAIARGL